MAGIYLHIPFCKKACHYCNFHFSTSLQLKNDFVAALLKEIKLRKEYIGEEIVETIYFGGGTPSLLSEEELKTIVTFLHAHYRISANAEITLEANPDDITPKQLKEWKAAGINRLSIGVQSFFDEHLVWMNRVHNAGQTKDSIRLAQQQGFHNITIDLIYGVPGLSNEQWKQNIEQALELNIPHLSCYALTVEPATALQKMIAQKKVADVIPETQAQQFLQLTERLEQAGYEHYEISNFAKPGQRSRHNSSYWTGAKYIGLGPSAHSFNGVARQWNVANNALYIQSLKDNKVPFEIEWLTKSQQLNEYIMTSLRTVEGLNLQYVISQFEQSSANRILQLSQAFITSGKLQQQGNCLQLTREGKLFADGIAAELFS